MEEESWWHAYIPKSIICLREKYSWQIFRKDLVAGLTVGVVALPLAMAFAIASGVSPEKGLFTAIIAGFLISLLGGSRVQIGGPAGAFVVVIYGVIQRHGYEGLVIATLMAAVLLVIMGLCRLGNLVKFIPFALCTGLTAALGILVLSLQIKDFFGLPLTSLPVSFLDKWALYFQYLPQLHVTNFLVALSTLGIIVLFKRYLPSLPWGITAIVITTLGCIVFGINIETIHSRFGEIPRMLPSPNIPYFELKDLIRLLPDAIGIALLAGIESLLSALVADNMIGKKHKSNCELMAQGIANLGSVIFGGIPATGAIARTAANVNSGATTPIAGMIHAVTLLLIMLFLSPLVGYIPMAALAAVLMVVAWNLIEVHRLVDCLKGRKRDALIMLATFFLIVLHDLLIGIVAGLAIYGMQKGFEKWKARAALK